MRTHNLKTWPSQFQATVAGLKRHEWRRNDRDFGLGDELVLREFEPHEQRYTGRVLYCRVTWVTLSFGVPDGWCVMSIDFPTLGYDCPKCGSLQVQTNEAGEVRCADCGYEYTPPPTEDADADA